MCASRPWLLAAALFAATAVLGGLPAAAAARSINGVVCPATEVEATSGELPVAANMTYLLRPGVYNVSSTAYVPAASTTCYVGASRGDVVVRANMDVGTSQPSYFFLFALVGEGAVLGLQGLTADGQLATGRVQLVGFNSLGGQLAFNDVTLRRGAMGIATIARPLDYKLVDVRFEDIEYAAVDFYYVTPLQPVTLRDVEFVRCGVYGLVALPNGDGVATVTFEGSTLFDSCLIGIESHGNVTMAGTATFLSCSVHAVVSQGASASVKFNGPARFTGCVGSGGPALRVVNGARAAFNDAVCLKDNRDTAGSNAGAVFVDGASSLAFSFDPARQGASGNTPANVAVAQGGSLTCNGAALSYGSYARLSGGPICEACPNATAGGTATCAGCLRGYWTPAACACVDCAAGPCCSVADGRFLNGTLCRARTSVCDAADFCNGTQSACPTDAKQPDGSLCRWTHHAWAHPYMVDASGLRRTEVGGQPEAEAVLQASGAAASVSSGKGHSEACFGRCFTGRCVLSHKTARCCVAHGPASREEYEAELQQLDQAADDADSQAAAAAHPAAAQRRSTHRFCWSGH